MAILTFTLSEEGVAAFRDALACIVKFSEDVCLEAQQDKLVLSALNLTKSAYVRIVFASNRFFSQYVFEGSDQYPDKFFCHLFIRSLLSVFRVRTGDREREKETTIEHCDVTVDDGPVKSRLTAKIVCRNGITATHALPFEPKAPTHAKFNKDEGIHHWTMSSRTLRQLMDHFGPGIDLLDINTDNEGVVNFTGSEKAINLYDDALRKIPLHTSIAVDMEEFKDIEVDDKLHIVIPVKDFRSILHHAQPTSGELSACFGNPGCPMRFTYGADGLHCEFLLMTIGDKDATGPRSRRSRSSVSRTPRPGLEAASHRSSSVATEDAPEVRPPPQPKTPVRPRQSQFEIRPPPLPPASTLRSELFVAQDDDDDEPWEPLDSDDEENARLEWDASGRPPSNMRLTNAPTQAETESGPDRLASGLEPTQRLSEVRRFGLFSP